MPLIKICTGDALTWLRQMAPNSVHCCVTSPPYFGLRDYGTSRWEGGDPNCTHRPDATPEARGIASSTLGGGKNHTGHKQEGFVGSCPRCGAVRSDPQIGLEQTPTEYVAKLVEVFEEVRRVLRPDGTLWLNLGDSYASAWVCNRRSQIGSDSLPNGKRANRPNRLVEGLKEKDLMGIPWRVAFALQAQGWYLRQDIIWAKPNPMPESVRDRCTKSHEYLFLLTKSEHYYFDSTAIAEPVADSSKARLAQPTLAQQSGSTRVPGKTNGNMKAVGSGDKRNRRSVWTITTKPFKEAHFATFPPDLVEPCLRAGTSEHGCCPQCASPWRRVVHRKGMVIARSERTHEKGRSRSSGTMLEPATTTTLGFYPSCACIGAPRLPPYPEKPHYEDDLEAMTKWTRDRDAVRAERIRLVEIAMAYPTTSAVVLDPFAGAGTTGVVAKQLDRHVVLIELNPDYVKLIEKRLNPS